MVEGPAEGLIERRPCQPRLIGQDWRCARWQAGPGEWFCGECGEPLPPLQLELVPDIGQSAADGEPREVMLACRPNRLLTKEELRDFNICVSTDDSRERDRSIGIPLTPDMAESLTDLELNAVAGLGAFDVTVAIRHVRRSEESGALVVGQYDYPSPLVSLEAPGPIIIPCEPGPFAMRLRIDPPEAAVLSADLVLESGSIPASAEQGQLVTLSFSPDPDASRSLLAFEGDAAARLLLGFRGMRDLIALDVRLQRPTPARLEFAVVEDVMALTGRPARIGAMLRNAGGMTAQIDRIEWILLSTASGAEVARDRLPALATNIIGSGKQIICELRPMMRSSKGEPLAPGRHTLRFEVWYREEGASTSRRAAAAARSETRSVRVEIRPEAPFKGLVCVDFGTTDTAVAILPSEGHSYFHNPRDGSLPEPIELGVIRVTPSPDDEESLFLPTLAAVGEEADGTVVTLFGRDARDRVTTLKHGQLLDRLKWRFSNAGLNHGVSIGEIVKQYLAHVRALIEEHPRVAATVPQVIATRPARYPPAMILSLIDVLGPDGTNPTRFGERSSGLVSESWPPTLLAIPFEEVPGEPPSRRLFEVLAGHEFEDGHDTPPFDRGALGDNPHFLCTFDIGGGSTDISLLRIKAADKGPKIDVTELDTLTTTKFAGEMFRNLIVETILEGLPAVPASSTEGTPLANLLKLRDAASIIQRYPNGPFRPLRSTAKELMDRLTKMSAKDRTLLFAHLIGADRKEAEPQAVTKLREWWAHEMLAYLDPKHFFEIVLEGAEGAEVVFAFRSSAAADVLLRVTLRFFQRYHRLIDRIFARLAAKFGDAGKKERIRVLLTGRGSMFPLNDVMIGMQTEKYGIAPLYFDKLAGRASKTVTSLGGCALVASHQRAKFLNFIPAGNEQYYIYADFPGAPAQFAALRQIDSSSWGLPLAELEDFADFCFLRVLDSPVLDEGSQPLTELEDFDWKAECKSYPGGWVYYDEVKGAISIGQPREGPEEPESDEEPEDDQA